MAQEPECKLQTESCACKFHARASSALFKKPLPDAEHLEEEADAELFLPPEILDQVLF